MIDLRDGKITDLINNPMSYNPETVSIGYAILQEKQRLLALAERTRLMAVVENLDEWVLDYLAVELRAPAYEDSFPIEVKRELIAGTLPFYAKLGTPQAINWATRTIFGGSQLQEWFEYGGEPFHFKMKVNITDDIFSLEKDRQVINAINVCKNLRSHLDGIEYFIKAPTALAYAGAVLLSHSGQVWVSLKPDSHWPRSEVGAASGAVFLASSGICSVELPKIKASWPRVRIGALAGAVHLGAFGVCSVELPRVSLQWPRVKTRVLLGGALLGMSGVCSVNVPRVALRWPRVGVSGAAEMVVLSQTMYHRATVQPKKLAWPKSTATTKFGVAVLGVYQKITV
ncbi:phage tail protein [Acutalibacter sp. 1XD8-36]|uniref:phage tail protein n=1 Tax=Acutalibacter sp. 1XD8-36 TaxID=2320852 RepID=UPI00141297C2|nr:phage tail protein [Acutalibacter sp. 1XD8-36]